METMTVWARRAACGAALMVAACGEGPTSPPVATLSIEPAELTLLLRETLQFTTVQRDAAGTVLPPQPVLWLSSNRSVLELGGEGFAKALRPGRSTVRAVLAGASAEAAVTVPRLDFVQVAPGRGFTCGVTVSAVAYCWGKNLNGQLGNGTTEWDTVPAPVAGGVRFRAISAGSLHSCALTPNGAVYCWGMNALLGNGSATQTVEPMPIPVAGGHTFTSVHAGGWVTCGRVSGGATYCWGDNTWGQVGDGTTNDRYVPTPVAGDLTFVALTTRAGHVCGLTSSGTAYCWGHNLGGSLGDGTVTDRSVPTRVVGDLVFGFLSAGLAHTCGVTVDGFAYCWGARGLGVGDGVGAGVSSPVPVVGGLSFAAVGTGTSHTCGLTTDGKAYCWGDNETGELGQPRTELSASLVPVPVMGGLTFVSLAVGNNHACGEATDGIVYCWGANVFGQLGIGTYSVGSHLPVPIFGQQE